MKEIRSRLLHLGCGLCAPENWVNVDASWNAWLSQRPLLMRLVKILSLAPRAQLEIKWPKNILICDVRKPLPFNDGSFDAVYASHLLEHLHLSDAQKLLLECNRVLRANGVCRIVVPDLESLINEYLNNSKNEPKNAAELLMKSLNMHPFKNQEAGLLYSIMSIKTGFHSHKFMYDKNCLKGLMEEAVFLDCRIKTCLESIIPEILIRT